MVLCAVLLECIIIIITSDAIYLSLFILLSAAIECCTQTCEKLRHFWSEKFLLRYMCALWWQWCTQICSSTKPTLDNEILTWRKGNSLEFIGIRHFQGSLRRSDKNYFPAAHIRVVGTIQNVRICLSAIGHWTLLSIIISAFCVQWSCVDSAKHFQSRRINEV